MYLGNEAHKVCASLACIGLFLVQPSALLWAQPEHEELLGTVRKSSVSI